MRRRRLASGSCLSGIGALCLSAVLGAAGLSAVADAAMRGDREAVRVLLKQGQDVNAAQGDGMTALHWAALKGDADLAQMLVYAGANVRATTRLGAYTPLYLAARGGQSRVVATLLAAGADPNTATTNGTTPLMIGAASGDDRTVTMLIENGADVNAVDSAKGETALMFAAGFDRVDAIKALLARGADPNVTTKIVDLAALTAPEEENTNRQQQGQGAQSAQGAQGAQGAQSAQGAQGAQSAAAGRGGAARVQRPGVDRPYRYNELIGTQGGLAAIHFAARQGYKDSVAALIDGGADVNRINPGDRTSPLLIAVVNGHFDLAKYLIEKGADVSLAGDNGVTPLYAALNVRWAPKSLYPGPKAYQQQTLSYLDLMKILLEKGADPNVRVRRKVWYQAYNFDLAGVDENGATPFWRAAYASDVEAMRLLVAHGADPNIPTMKPAGRPRAGDTIRDATDVSGLPPIPVGGPGVPPLLAASGVGYGEGFAANAHRYAPTGFLPAIQYLVEDLGADVNAIDHEGSTALHHAAARGDTESILYLVSKGADVTKVNREGQTVADMANGPVQRVQPFPDTLALLMKLGAKNSNRCITC